MFEALTVGRLRAKYAWLEPLVGGRAPGAVVTTCVYIFIICMAALCIHGNFFVLTTGLWGLLPVTVLGLIMVASKSVIK